MVTALLLASVVSTHTLYATDDVWVYPHSQDQTGDPSLRAWGDGENSVGVMDSSSFSCSWSLVRFDLSSIAEPLAKLSKATLVLYHIGDAHFTVDESKASPLEARLVDAGFDEKRWSFEQYAKFAPVPGDKTLLGRASAKPSSDGKPFMIEIDLLSGKGDFKNALEGKKAVGIALTTKMAPEGTDGTYYVLMSRSTEKEFHPRLILEYAD